MKTPLGLFPFLLCFVCTLLVSAADINRIEWIPQVSNSTASLRGVSAVNQKIAWASGSGGTFLRTVDGGKHWQAGKVPGAEGFDFRDVHAVDQGTALLMAIAEPAKIFKTSDGGNSWKQVYENETAGIFFSSMEFWDEKNGIAISDPVEGRFVIIISKDGGESWHQIASENMPAPVPGEALFAASGTCIAFAEKGGICFATGGSLARIFRSYDSGKTWTVSPSPIRQGKPSRGIFSIAFGKSNNGVVVGGDYRLEKDATKNIALSKDGGKVWHLIEDTPPSGFRSCVKFLPWQGGELLVAVGPSGSDFSLDGGVSWKGFGSFGYHSFSITPGGAGGWAVGAGGRVAKLLIE